MTYPDREALQAARNALVDGQVALVSPELPLRVNLSAQENVALVPLYLKDLTTPQAAREAADLLGQLGYANLSPKREADMSPAERFITQLARALMLKRSRLIIDRPGAMLYDVHYPEFIRLLRSRVPGEQTWEIFDFAWNRPLYES
jgi:predicted ABC-type transport system involved in lysophospholipase L1 biosynthesis ATPase subunit